MKERSLMYEFDDSAAAIGVFLLTIFMVLIFYIATPAHSQEAPAGPPCAPWRDIHSMLEKQFGETTTAGGIIGDEFMELMTSREGTFTILMRRLDGTACIVAGGKGFALADRSKMKGPGL